jgi:hypothetical protein
MDTKQVLKDHLKVLQDEKQKRRDVVAPLKEQREKLVQRQQAIQSEIDVLTLKINEGLGGDFSHLSTEIANVARALGAVSMTEAR